ncbi:MAG TPA: nucleotide disphospho-sugar-binding domain-containing protein [Anaerolineales bacterium]|nr:nucleotide disphospho-sugar-binding domain-containing protein [Anaerolineales bacterium]
MIKKLLLFAPVTFDLAETTRMIEIAKGILQHELASKVFDIQFISNGGDLEHLIEEEGFPLKRLEPRLTQEKIEFIGAVDKGETFAPAFTQKEIIPMIENEVEYLKQLKPTAVITGSYMTIPVTCRILKIPLVWVIQSTWLADFFTKGAGMTDNIKFRPLKEIADWFILLFINFWIRYGFLGPVNQAAQHFGVEGYPSIFDYWRGDITMVAEPAEFAGVELAPNYYYTGPLIARQDFPIPGTIKNIPHDKPIIYFAMGSSGTPEIIANIIESFQGKPYRVIAPVKNHLDKVRKVKIPSNVIVTDWLPAHEVNKIADLSLIHGGIGTVMTAAYAGKPVVGVGMQTEQVANLACLVRKGFAIRVPKSRDPSKKIQAAIQQLLHNSEAKQKAEEFSKIIEKWDGPKMAADLLYQKFGNCENNV